MSKKKHKKQCNRKVNTPYTINVEQEFNKINKLIEDINNSLLPICNEIKEKQDILAQNFDLFIGSTIQLTENATNPINLTINDLAVSRTH